jgi:hypothetical protein
VSFRLRCGYAGGVMVTHEREKRSKSEDIDDSLFSTGISSREIDKKTRERLSHMKKCQWTIAKRHGEKG